MSFSFRELQKKHSKKNDKEHKETQLGQKLVLFQDFQINPLVIQQCKKIERDYARYYNNNRYFYLHIDPSEINTTDKIKGDQFHKIRRESEVALFNQTNNKQLVISDVSPRKRVSKSDKQLKFRHYSYLFRKNIKIIIQKLKKLKITVKDIFQKGLFNDEPYKFGKSIFQAVKSGQQTKLWRYYIQNKFVVYSVDSTKKTLLSWACIRGYTQICEMLIDMGVVLNKKDIVGHSALYYAIHYKHESCVKLLLLHQASLTAEDIALANQDKRIKNITQLCQSIMGIIQKMPFEKRSEVFQERLKHLT